MIESEIANLAKRINDLETRTNMGEVGNSGVRHWAFALRGLSNTQFQFLEALADAPLGVLMLETSDGDPRMTPQEQEILGAVQNAWAFYEEWSMNDEFLSAMSNACGHHHPLHDTQAWEFIFCRMPITPADFKALQALSEDELELVAGGSSYGVLDMDPDFPALVANHPDYDYKDLDNRMAAAYALWDTYVQSCGDEWVEFT